MFVMLEFLNACFFLCKMRPRVTSLQAAGVLASFFFESRLNFKSLFTVVWPASVIKYHMKGKHYIYLFSHYVCDLQMALQRKSR